MGEMADYYREQEWLYGEDGQQDPTEADYAKMNGRTKMAKTTKAKTIKHRHSNKPTLIACGKHFINPKDIQRITRVEKGNKTLYVVRFLSEPNPDFACWLRGDEIEPLLEQFNIIVSDDGEGN